MMAVLRLARVTLVVWVAFAVSCTASTPVTFTDAQISDILRKAVANWLHAIYAQDLDALRAASASEQLYRDGLFLMDDETFQFMEEPSADLIDITIHHVYVNDGECIVVDHTGDATTILGQGWAGRDVAALWQVEGVWALGASGPPALEGCPGHDPG